MRLLWIVGFLVALRLPAQSIAITGVTVIDVAGGRAVPGQVVVVDRGAITAAGPASRVAVPRGARRVDGRGRYLVPGLWDMHVHLSMIGRNAMALFLANGVTGVRDMGGDPALVLAWRDSVAAGRLEGPRIKAPGNIVESARWLSNVTGRVEKIDQPELLAELRRRFGLETPEDAVRAVDSLQRMGVDFIKIRNYPAPATYAALARAARERGLRIAGHGPLAPQLAMVSDSGFASYEHGLLGIAQGKLADAFDVLDTAAVPLMRRFAANGTAWDPTLVSGRTRFLTDTAIQRLLTDTTGATDPLLRYVSRTLRREWRSNVALEGVSDKFDWSPLYRANLRDVRRMADAGVTILAGTDVAVTSLIPGFSLLDELELLVREGHLTPAEALASATVNPARVLGLADSRQGIAQGQRADLVLLDANPLADIGAVRRIRAVVAGGRFYDRAALDRLLDGAAAAR